MLVSVYFLSIITPTVMKVYEMGIYLPFMGDFTLSVAVDWLVAYVCMS